jgi:hypothetical protein
LIECFFGIELWKPWSETIILCVFIVHISLKV